MRAGYSVIVAALAGLCFPTLVAGQALFTTDPIHHFASIVENHRGAILQRVSGLLGYADMVRISRTRERDPSPAHLFRQRLQVRTRADAIFRLTEIRDL